MKKWLSMLLAAVLFLAVFAHPVQVKADTNAAALPPAPQCQIIYDFGAGNAFVVGPEVAMSMMCTHIDGSYMIDPNTGYYALDPNKLMVFLQALNTMYPMNTGSNFFTTTSGRQIAISPRKGMKSCINVAQEMGYLANAIMMQEVTVRQPICSPCSTYVEVDMTNQHAYFYRDGAPLWDAPVVTGNTSLRHGTPEGVYSIQRKNLGQYLVGADYVSYVNYWMPFIGNSYGLHDATWRKSFGGQIYRTAGSHGCVNLPLEKAKELYNLVEVGTPVILFY